MDAWRVLRYPAMSGRDADVSKLLRVDKLLVLSVQFNTASCAGGTMLTHVDKETAPRVRYQARGVWYLLSMLIEERKGRNQKQQPLSSTCLSSSSGSMAGATFS